MLRPTLIKDIRQTEPNVFLFDSGDIFTGALAKLTEGRLAFELMITLGYDAMAIGNHEFEYGHEIFAWQKNRAPFPVLGANFFYKGTDHPYAQAHAIIERNGIRIGVIGIMQTYGQATHLGYLQLTLACAAKSREITAHEGRLIPVDPALYAPDPAITAKLTDYRSAFPEIQVDVGR